MVWNNWATEIADTDFQFTVSFANLQMDGDSWSPGTTSQAVATPSNAVPSIAADQAGVFVLTTSKLSRFSCTSTSCSSSGTGLSGDTRIIGGKGNVTMTGPLFKGGQVALDTDGQGIAVRACVSTVGGKLLSINPSVETDEGVVVCHSNNVLTETKSCLEHYLPCRSYFL